MYINDNEIESAYSTTEQKIGTWIDGKPIYRKVFKNLSFGNTIGSWTNTGASITEIQTMTQCRAIGTSNSSSMIPLQHGYRIVFNVSTRIGAIQYYAAHQWGCTGLIIEYTKNTD